MVANPDPNNQRKFRFVDASFYEIFYSFERKLRKLFITRYLVPMKPRNDMLPDNREDLVGKNEDLRNEIGYSGELIDPYILCSGVKVVTDSNNSTANDDVMSVMFSAPLICNPDTFGAFSSLVFNSPDRFLGYLVMILTSVPVVYVYTADKLKYYWTVFPASMLLYYHFRKATSFQIDFTWNFTWNDINLNSNSNYRAETSPLKNSVVTNKIAEIIKLNFEIIMTKAITIKCMRDWDKDLTCGYFVICDPNPKTNKSSIDWIDDFRGYNNPNVPGDLSNKFSRTVVFHLIDKFGFKNEHFGIQRDQNPLDVNLVDNQVYFVNSGYDLEQGITILRDVANPFACFGSLNEEDFSAFSLLMFTTLPVLFSMLATMKQKSRGSMYSKVLNVANIDPFEYNVTLLTAMISIVYGGTLMDESVQSLYFNRVRILLNECLNRKIFKINRITKSCFIKSTPDYAFLYIIPLEKANYNIKYYMKRDFFNFFKFFDNVYYKPRYLRYLTDEGLMILKHLSKFDSNFIDSLGARMYLSSKIAAGP